MLYVHTKKILSISIFSDTIHHTTHNVRGIKIMTSQISCSVLVLRNTLIHVIQFLNIHAKPNVNKMKQTNVFALIINDMKNTLGRLESTPVEIKVSDMTKITIGSLTKFILVYWLILMVCQPV